MADFESLWQTESKEEGEEEHGGEEEEEEEIQPQMVFMGLRSIN